MTESKNEELRDRKYLLSQGKLVHNQKEISVAVAVESNSDGSARQSDKKIPRLFKAVPLVGTESFSFPVVINSLGFEPSEDRDDVYIGQGNDEANIKNQAVIEKSCALLVCLLQHAASEGWYYAHQWAEVPTIQHPTEETRKWLRKCIREKFIKEICQTRVVLTEVGKTKTPKDAWLPLAENNEGVKELWSLLNDLQEYREKLPRQDEAIGWRKVIQSWTKVNECEVSDLPDVGVKVGIIDGRKLADHIKNKCSCLKDLQNLLRENVCAVAWLNRFYKFLKNNGFDDIINKYPLVPNQVDEFYLLNDLHNDKNIDEELKTIDKSFFTKTICKQLRHTGLTSLEGEENTKEWYNNDVIELLIRELQKQVKKNPDEKIPDDNFKQASAHLFAWIVRKDQKDYWDLLPDVPVFTKDGKSHHSLRSASPNSTPPLAPVCAWSEDLREFSELFPTSQILTSDFFEILPEAVEWRKLNEKKFIRMDTDIIIRERKQINFRDFCPKDELDESDDREHKTADCIPVTDVAELSRIMTPLRDNKKLAVKFWRFLTEWLIKKDAQGLEIKTAKCSICDQDHKYYSAAWMKPVRDNHWVGRAPITAKSLANLLQNSEWKLRSLDTDAVKLLKAIGESPSDLRFELMAGNPEERDAVVHTMTELHQAFKGDLSPINTLLNYTQNNESLPQDLEEILEATGGDLSQVVEDVGEQKEQQDRMAENREFGKRVEKRVRQLLNQNLKPKGFSVTRKYTGSDLEILPETFDISTEEIIQNDDKKWLVEIKGTRVQNVKMSFEQTKNALDKKEEFLLCVVPIPEDTQPDFDTVRENILFIKNIHRKLGKRVATLCNSIDRQKAVKDDDTLDDPSPGINLDFEAGTAGIRVNHSVWKTEGFPLEKLAEHLKQTSLTSP